MFSKLSAKSDRVFRCPDCGAALDGLPDRRAQVITCKSCGTKASAAEWTQPSGGNSMVGRADEPPEGTKIRRESAPERTVWEIPAHGKFGFFMFFGGFWTLITAAVSGGFLFTILTGGEIEGNMPEWMIIPFFGVFWAIGLTFLYFGVHQKWMTHRLTVNQSSLVLRREMFGRSKEKSLPVSEIQSIEQKEFYKQNYQPVYGIELRAKRGKLRFGSGLDVAEKAWLVADLRAVVFGESKSDHSEIFGTGSASTAGDAFSVVIPHSRKHLLPFVIMLGFPGACALAVSMTFLNDQWEGGGKNAPVFLQKIEEVFNSMGAGMQTVFFLIGVVMLAGAVALLAYLFRNRDTVRKLEGNSVDVAIRTYRNSLVWKEQSYPRRQITDIRASVSGNAGAKIMKRLELISGNVVIKLASWVDGDAADAVVAKVRPCL